MVKPPGRHDLPNVRPHHDSSSDLAVEGRPFEHLQNIRSGMRLDVEGQGDTYDNVMTLARRAQAADNPPG